MKKILLIFLALFIFGSTQIQVYAQDDTISPTYISGEVLDIVSAPELGGFIVKVDTKNGTLNDVLFTPSSESDLLHIGERVVVSKTEYLGQTRYVVSDRYRLPSLIWIFVGFFVLVLILTRLKGLFSFVGLLASILVLTAFMAPNLLGGVDPLLVSIVGCLLISVSSMVFAHGLNIKTFLSIGSTLITLCVGIALAYYFVGLSNLSGMGSEDAYFLYLQKGSLINLQGILLAGIVVGALGVLDDITTAQTAVVEELKKANPSLNFGELFMRASSVGTEHIASLVNTLVLAYAGASLPMFLLFYVANDRPIWVTVNSEFFSEEIIRTLVGSFALVLAVPIATLLASSYFSKYPPKY